MEMKNCKPVHTTALDLLDYLLDFFFCLILFLLLLLLHLQLRRWAWNSIPAEFCLGGSELDSCNRRVKSYTSWFLHLAFWWRRRWFHVLKTSGGVAATRRHSVTLTYEESDWLPCTKSIRCLSLLFCIGFTAASQRRRERAGLGVGGCKEMERKLH